MGLKELILITFLLVASIAGKFEEPLLIVFPSGLYSLERCYEYLSKPEQIRYQAFGKNRHNRTEVISEMQIEVDKYVTATRDDADLFYPNLQKAIVEGDLQDPEACYTKLRDNIVVNGKHGMYNITNNKTVDSFPASMGDRRIKEVISRFEPDQLHLGLLVFHGGKSYTPPMQAYVVFRYDPNCPTVIRQYLARFVGKRGVLSKYVSSFDVVDVEEAMRMFNVPDDISFSMREWFLRRDVIIVQITGGKYRLLKTEPEHQFRRAGYAAVKRLIDGLPEFSGKPLPSTTASYFSTF